VLWEHEAEVRFLLPRPKFLLTTINISYIIATRKHIPR